MDEKTKAILNAIVDTLCYLPDVPINLKERLCELMHEINNATGGQGE